MVNNVTGLYAMSIDAQTTLDDMYYRYRKTTMNPVTMQEFVGNIISSSIKHVNKPTANPRSAKIGVEMV
jgi:hypothetical protein